MQRLTCKKSKAQRQSEADAILITNDTLHHCDCQQILTILAKTDAQARINVKQSW